MVPKAFIEIAPLGFSRAPVGPEFEDACWLGFLDFKHRRVINSPQVVAAGFLDKRPVFLGVVKNFFPLGVSQKILPTNQALFLVSEPHQHENLPAWVLAFRSEYPNGLDAVLAHQGHLVVA